MATSSPLEAVLAKVLVQQHEAASRQEQQILMQQQQLQKQIDMFERQERFMVTQQQTFQGIINRDPETLVTTGETNSSSLQTSRVFSREQLMDILAKQMSEFVYDAEENRTFGSWFARYEDLFHIDAQNLSDTDKTRLLLRKVSQPVYQQYADVVLPSKPMEISFEITVERLKSMFGQRDSLFSTRYKCFQTNKSESEDYGAYIAKVNRHCENFQLEKFTKDNLKCLVFVSGLQSSKDANFRNEILKMLDEEKPEKPVSLEFINKEIQRTLQRQQDIKMIANMQPVQTQAVHTKRLNSKYNKNHKDNSKTTPPTPCWFCGAMHYSNTCQYKTHKCKLCHRVGHKEGYCKVKATKSNNNNNGKSSDSNSTNSRKNYYENSNKNSAQTKTVDNSIDNLFHRKYVNILINNENAELQLDTASDISIISEQMWEKVGRPTLTTTKRTARDANQNKINFIGEFKANAKFRSTTGTLNIFVTTVQSLNIAGSDFFEKFGLWEIPINSFCKSVGQSADYVQHVADLKKEFPQVFKSEMGHCTRIKIHLPLKANAVPKFCPKRPVPYSVYSLVDAELNRLQEAGVISQTNFSEWAAPIVTVRRSNGKIRICGDYSTGLNENVEPHFHPLPLPEDIFMCLNNRKFFTRLDFNDAYMQFEVDDATKSILTINTHRGLYTFNRLVPGIKSAPGAFQQTIEKILSGISEATAYLDDVIIASETLQQHLESIRQVLQRFTEYNLTVNWDKCEFIQSQIKYLGHIVDSNGIKPNQDKISSIINLPRPQNVSELRSFLGSINFYGKFIDTIRSLRFPLDKLLETKTKWHWSSDCEHSFQKFKKVLLSDLMLTHYNPKLPIIVSADASMQGLGAQISHIMPDGTEKPVAHASRSLTPAEKNYGQIEKEALALVFAVKKFHRMIYGRKFLLRTDHKPLLAIFGSRKGIPVHSASRLQRWALTMMTYDFDIEYVNTDDFGNVDMLSRLIPRKQREDEDFVIACATLEYNIKSILRENLQYIPLTHHMIQVASEKDSIIQQVIKHVQTSWPKKSKDLSSNELLPFYNRRSSLSVVDNCLLNGERIVIPQTFRKRILKTIHKGHQGQQRMKSIARGHVYWPNIDQEIEDFVRLCPQCQINAKSPSKTTLCSWPISTRPLQRIHIDIAGPIRSQYYLVIIDSFSKWPEVYQCNTISSKKIIDLMSDYSNRFGYPELLVSDNGTQFVSSEFQQFCNQRGIQHIKTAPYHPQSNGQAERYVDIIKTAIRKAYDCKSNDNTHLQEFLLQYRSTPNSNCVEGKTPAELFIGRKLRTEIDILKPRKPTEIIRNDKMENEYNRKHGSKNRKFSINQQVFIKIYKNNKMTWQPGVIKEKVGHVNYQVEVQDNGAKRIIKSHANQIRERYTNTDPDENDSMSYDLQPLFRKQSDENEQQQNEIEQQHPDLSVSSQSVHPNNDECANVPSYSHSAYLEDISSPPRRSTRSRRRPAWHQDYEVHQ